MECQQTRNLQRCNCTYSCSRRGLCCECIAYHREAGELPACYFDAETERRYDRSIEAYLRMKKK